MGNKYSLFYTLLFSICIFSFSGCDRLSGLGSLRCDTNKLIEVLGNEWNAYYADLAAQDRNDSLQRILDVIVEYEKCKGGDDKFSNYQAFCALALLARDKSRENKEVEAIRYAKEAMVRMRKYDGLTITKEKITDTQTLEIVVERITLLERHLGNES